MKLYAVVQFLGTDEVEAVPLSWLKSNDEGTVCSWPPYPATATTRIMNAISQRIFPSDEWPEYAAKIIKKCGNCLFCVRLYNFLELLSFRLDFCTVNYRGYR